MTRLWKGCSALLLVVAATFLAGSAARPAWTEVPAAPYLYLPSADPSDGRMLSVASEDMGSLAGETIHLCITVPGDRSSFEIGIFDGDTGAAGTDTLKPGPVPHWDLGSGEVEYALFAEYGAYETLVGAWRGNDTLQQNGIAGDFWTASSPALPDNDWWTVTVQTSEDARETPGADFQYVLTATLLDTVAPQQISNFKVRTTGTLYLRNSLIGYEGALRQTENDGPILYPGWNPSAPLPRSGYFLNAPTTYDGRFLFLLDVPPGVTAVNIYDGDLDYGTMPGHTTGVPSGAALDVAADTDDPDTPPNFRPPGTTVYASNEAAAGAGNPPEDHYLDRCRRAPAISYRLVDPGGTVYNNPNPSGNREWERFRVAVAGTPEAASADYVVAGPLPAGDWRLEVTGQDLANTVNLGASVDIEGVPQFLVGDAVFEDRNVNGVQDTGEPGVNNVLVRLLDAGGAVTATTRTDAQGYYAFPVSAGTWTVLVDPINWAAGGPLAGMSATTPTSLTDTVTDRNLLRYDFGFASRPLGLNVLGDRVWEDLNANGIQDPGEPGLSAQTVELYRLVAGAWERVSTTTTYGNGEYHFDALPDGTYAVQFYAPAGYHFSPMLQGTNPEVDSDPSLATGRTAALSLAAGETIDLVDAGLYRYATAGDTVWLDSDRDGVFEPVNGEQGLAGVRIELRNSGGSLVGTATTNASGGYLFPNVVPRTYRVSVVTSTLPAGLTPTYDRDGVGTPNTAVGVLASGQLALDFDFGYRPTVNVNVQDSGYWKNHPSQWPVNQLWIGGVLYNKTALLAILNTAPAGDVRYILAPQLIVAKLNVAAGCPSAVIDSTLVAADAWLAPYGLLYPAGSGTPVPASSPAWRVGEPLKNQLSAYNDGTLR